MSNSGALYFVGLVLVVGVALYALGILDDNTLRSISNAASRLMYRLKAMF